MNLLSALVIAASLVALVRLLPVDRLVASLAARVEQLGFWGPLAFGAAYLVATVCFVPGSALTLAAGAIFGLARGTAVVSVASTAAAAVSFLIARYAARDTVAGWARRSPRFAAIDRAISQGGWKVVALLRLSPAIPFSLGNYLYGLTGLRFGPYVLASWIAMLPGTFLYIYLGHAGAAAASGGGGRTPAQWAFLAAGLAATLVVTVYVTRLARRAVPLSGGDAPAEPPRRSRPWVAAAGAALAVTAAAAAVVANVNAGRVRALFGPPSVKMEEAYARKPGGPRFDHGAFDALLKRHVKPGGFVDYAALKAESAALDGYLAAVAKAPFDDLDRDEKLALLINAYNAFTLRLILDRYPLKSIKDIADEARWDARRWIVGGRTLSLNQLEHEEIRPKFREPRVHFALVCAAVGCPPLRAEAYRGEAIEAQLEAQSAETHAGPRWFRFKAGEDRVELTRLYDWYAGDFEQAAGSVSRYAARWSPALKGALDSGKSPSVKWLPYDWSLNSTENTQ
ncbi:MAG: VTT domain-containing protein [Planctomycetes bacterium]|nr:VTT domain-containing protein [Planctomycetota bacterium]